MTSRNLLIAVVVACTGAISAHAADPVRVASKIDTEGALLGNLIIAALAANGIATIDRLQLGPTSIVRRALVAGEIDLYPEYTGNGAVFFALDRDPAWHDAAAGYEKVRALDLQANQLVWLQPAPASNAWAIALRGDLAAANHLVSLADLARWIHGGGTFKLAASAEFVESPGALPAFESAYGFSLGRDQLLALAGGDTSATERAAAERTSGVNAAMAYGTDGALDALNLTVLTDPAKAQIVYAPAPVVRQSALATQPRIRDILDPVFRSLDLATLRGLNARIVIDGEDAKTVARDYLTAKAPRK
ncbi:MAG: transporter substrate-binding protein [Rhodospirillales bacterium]|nr:transporter substrate-binding protein [Rhodospirillales bacterium]